MSIIPGTRTIFPPGSKKAAQQDRLLRLYIEDPKRAKRLVLNRLSALRLRMKKKMCKGMLQQKVDTSKPESHILSSQLERAQENTNDLKVESTELKVQMLIERQIQLLNNLNREINNEIEYLRSMTGPALPSSPKNALIVAPMLAIQKTGT
ncbi:bZIP transcription factor 18-like [Punica granatum]|uniref:BZIP transcription factor 18-like n=2 Tax=Punica granatum TaxID=22663 RepID=A0A6P8EBP9_PUNGR|nr:bZIP transcription factor 18-like [Punica granatum]PKI55269.1 hypothetical protein CRG98_024285 [Punica granatum]